MPFVLPYLLEDDTTSTTPPATGITPASVPTGVRVPGPAAGTNPLSIRPASVPTGVRVPGPAAPAIPELVRPITPASVPTGVRVPGPWLVPPAPTDPTVPTIPAGPSVVAAGITVPGWDQYGVVAVDATPSVNQVGSARITLRGIVSPPENAVVGINVMGRRIFTGLNSRSTKAVITPDEEAGMNTQVELDGLLVEFGEVVVLPDFGASDPERLGQPIQDSRVFDWTMNGLGNASFGEVGANLIPSVSLDATVAALGDLFPLPDVWPDPTARWMWVRDPALTSQPRGFCHFRIPTQRYIGTMQLWCCAYDYAEVWLDGVPIMVCDQPGVAQSITIDSTYDFHLLTIKAYNAGGKAGVLCSLLPVLDTGLYGPPTMNSRSGWKALAYPTRTFISTPGQVLYRLRAEAARRGVWPLTGPGSWQFDFGELTDTAGRPWRRDDAITLDVGMTYLDVLLRLAESTLDFAASPAQRRLRCWVKDRGTGRDLDQLPWQPGNDTGWLNASNKIAVR